MVYRLQVFYQKNSRRIFGSKFKHTKFFYHYYHQHENLAFVNYYGLIYLLRDYRVNCLSNN